MESMANRLQGHPILNNTNFNNFIADLKALINNSLNIYKTTKQDMPTLFNEQDLKILENLKKNKNIIICKPDKGRGVVILDKEDYVTKMNTILNDHATWSIVLFPNLPYLTFDYAWSQWLIDYKVILY